jgi:hypothetical protein
MVTKYYLSLFLCDIVKLRNNICIVWLIWEFVRSIICFKWITTTSVDRIILLWKSNYKNHILLLNHTPRYTHKSLNVIYSVIVALENFYCRIFIQTIEYLECNTSKTLTFMTNYMILVQVERNIIARLE